MAPRIIIPAAMFMLLIGYQNFSDVAPSEWDSTTPLQVIREMQEFQKKDPGLPQELAVPQGGSDFDSVTKNWAERQGKILLNGFDKKVEDAVNDTLNSYLHALTDRSPAAEPKSAEENVADTENAVANAGTEATVATQAAPTEVKKRHLLKFPRPNVLKYEIGEESSFNLIANPGETKFNFSQAFNQHSQLGIEHVTSNSTTQMFFRYDW